MRFDRVKKKNNEKKGGEDQKKFAPEMRKLESQIEFFYMLAA